MSDLAAMAQFCIWAAIITFFIAGDPDLIDALIQWRADFLAEQVSK